MMGLYATTREPDPHVLRQACTTFGLVVAFFVLTWSYSLSQVPAALPSTDREWVQTRIDPNSAQWYEIAQLPGFGESTARHLVEHREEHLARRQSARRSDQLKDSGRVFTRPVDLTQVKGIGPRTVQRISPFLRFDDVPKTDLIDNVPPGR